MRAGQPEFEHAVREYAFDGIALDGAALARAAATLRATGLLLVGEPHGVRQTPAVVYALVRALGIRALAFEWSHEEDVENLWSLPASAEALSGDGRVTAGHFALLERMRRESRLEQLILFDRLDPEPAGSFEEHVRVRDAEMASRLLAVWDRRLPLLAVTGAFHAQLEPPTMGRHLAQALPGLEPAMLAYDGVPMPDAPIVFRLPPAEPAVTPEAPAA